MRAVFGDGHPVTAVGDPDQNIYAWRGASLWNLLHFRAEFPLPDGTESAQLPLYTNFRSGARILEAADRVIDALPANQRPDPDKLLRPWDRNGAGHVEVARYEHEIAEAEGVAERAHALHAEGVAWRDMAVLCRTHRLFEALQLAFGAMEVPAEFVNLAGLIHLPEIVEVLAYARATEDPRDGVALARILTGPRYRVGLRDLGVLAAWSRTSGGELRKLLADLALDEDDDLLEDHPFLMAEALERLDEIEGLTDEGRVRLAEFRDELDGAPRGGATTGRRVPRRDHPPDGAAGRAGFGRGPADGARAATQPRGVPRAGARVPARRRRAHAPGVPRASRLDRRRPRVEPGPAERRRLGEGDDGARGQGTRVRGGVRPGARARPVPGRARAAEPGAEGELARRRAPARPRPAAELRRQHEGVHRRPARTGGRRGTPHLLRGAHPREAAPVRLVGQLVRREPDGQGHRAVPGRAAQVGAPGRWSGLARRRARRGGRRGRPDQPARGVPAAVRQAVAGAGATRRPRRAVPGGLAPDRARGARTRWRRGLLARGPVRGRARRVRRGVGRAPYAGHASASTGGGGGRTIRLDRPPCRSAG